MYFTPVHIPTLHAPATENTNYIYLPPPPSQPSTHLRTPPRTRSLRSCAPPRASATSSHREISVRGTPNLPTKIIHCEICLLKISRKFPYGPQNSTRQSLESNPLKSRILVRRLAVWCAAWRDLTWHGMMRGGMRWRNVARGAWRGEGWHDVARCETQRDVR